MARVAGRFHLRRTMISVACGLALTTASAWLAAAFLDIKRGKLHNLKPGEGVPAYVGAPVDWTLRTWHSCWGPGLRYDLVSECVWAGSTIGASKATYPNRTLLRMTAGFPMPCLQWAAYADDAVPKGAGTNPWFVGIHLPGKGKIGTHVERALPLRPVLWPTLFNVSTYSVLSFLIITAIAAFKAGRRRQRGLCAHCGYSLSGLAACPECGTPAAEAPPSQTVGAT